MQNIKLLPEGDSLWVLEVEKRRNIELKLVDSIMKNRKTKILEAPMPKLKSLNAESRKSVDETSNKPMEDTTAEEETNDLKREDLFALHLLHRRRLYKLHADNLSSLSNKHFFYELMMWCHDQNIFLNSCLMIRKKRTEYRQHAFFVNEDVSRLTPLLAIPESLTIGFKDTNDEDSKNNLYDSEREKEFNKLNSGENADSDVCAFFFSALGMIVSDLMTAKNSTLTDPRSLFASLLSKVQTLQNAPYFDETAVFDPDEPCLADVLLQMIRNYINGGPLVNKVSRQELMWAVSVCLSHSTPLTIGTQPSIGIIPMVHLFPHGGERTNSYVVARNGREKASEKMNRFFHDQFHLDFSRFEGGKWIYVVCDRDLKKGEEVCLQAMAPVCDKDSEAEQMWRLSCGVPPEEYLPSSQIARRQRELTNEMIQKGEKWFSA